MKTRTAVVSEKGQVTIPKGIRDVLGINPGTVLEFEDQNGCLVARRVIHADPMDELVGAGDPALGRDSNAVLADMRGPGLSPELDR